MKLIKIFSKSVFVMTAEYIDIYCKQYNYLIRELQCIIYDICYLYWNK